MGLVLIVDPDPKVLRLLEATLRLKDLDVVKADTAAGALQWLKHHQPDLVISDTEMPDRTGFDLFRRLRGMAHLADVPFIFLSARSEPEDVVRGLALGADEYLRKPFAVDELLARVLRVLAERHPDSEPPPRAEFGGSLDRTALPEILRTLGEQRRSGLLRVDPRSLAAPGLIHLRQGRVVHCTFGLLDGPEALLGLLPHTEGTFLFDADDEIGGESFQGPVLPLLMEGYRLLDIGLLRRVDPRRPDAAATLQALIATHARLPDPETESAEFVETQVIELGSGTMELDLDDLELSDADAPVPTADPRIALPPRPAPAPPAALAADAADGSLDDEHVGSDTAEFAPGFDAAELEALEQHVVPSAREIAPTERLRTPREPAPAELLSLAPASSGRIMVVDGIRASPMDDSDDGAYGVALVDDTIAELDVSSLMSASSSSRGEGLDVMELFEELKGVALLELAAESVQLGTRSGRVIASNIAEATRRDTVAAFSAQAMQFAARDPDGTQFAALDAGDLHVLVVEIDHVRVLTMLFPRRPDPARALAIVRPCLEEWVGPR